MKPSDFSAQGYEESFEVMAVQCSQFSQTVKQGKDNCGVHPFHLGLHSQHAQQLGHILRHTRIHTRIIDIKITNLFIITLQREG